MAGKAIPTSRAIDEVWRETAWPPRAVLEAEHRRTWAWTEPFLALFTAESRTQQMFCKIDDFCRYVNSSPWSGIAPRTLNNTSQANASEGKTWKTMGQKHTNAHSLLLLLLFVLQLLFSNQGVCRHPKSLEPYRRKRKTKKKRIGWKEHTTLPPWEKKTGTTWWWWRNEINVQTELFMILYMTASIQLKYLIKFSLSPSVTNQLVATDDDCCLDWYQNNSTKRTVVVDTERNTLLLLSGMLLEWRLAALQWNQSSNKTEKTVKTW